MPTERVMKRPSWDEYFLRMAQLVAQRSTCLRRHVGCVAVSEDNRVLATGYNGVPTGLTHCNVKGCIREELRVPSGEKHELCWGVHAEQNAIIQAAKHAVSLKGAKLYCTTFPCSVCAKMLINVGIGSVYYIEGYKDSLSGTLLEMARVKVVAL